ncbi:hypothetical protein DAEQUDRAFT_760304 [Daedalea quercina L-15889]|uniref:DUF6535 domain-containing protein n=1 Tax=Daedalea quercina L-15889 TaxID=1314783 RepID=A0A165KZL7_9APHY|nr:hypothetical protein DAEQUDRAFT_760304 [Daedalea quercina L-15889]
MESMTTPSEDYRPTAEAAEAEEPLDPGGLLNDSSATDAMVGEDVVVTGRDDGEQSVSNPAVITTEDNHSSSGGWSDGHRRRKKTDDLSRLADKVCERERERVKRWRNEINSLLIFAGLFAAVITGFGVQYYTILQPPAPDYNTRTLEIISFQLASLVNQTNDTSGRPFSSATLCSSPDTHPAPTYIAALWFAALVCGLAAASIAISVNQWLNNLLTPAGLSGSGPHEQLRVWNLRHETFQRWRLAVFIDIPSVLLQIALILFLAGLVGYLWLLSVKIALPSLVLVALLMVFLLVTTIAPVVLAYTPFISPQSIFLRWLSNTVKLIYYIPTFKLYRWLWFNNTFESIEIWLHRRKKQYEARLVALRALRSRGYYSWTAEEAAHLQTEAGQIVDKTALANVFLLVKDVSQLVPRIESYLSEMPSDIASSNVLTICKRSNIASLVEPTDEEDEEEDHTQWQRDVLDKKIFVTMGTIIADRYSQILHSGDKSEIPPEALAAMDQLLRAVRDAEGGLKVYMRLFNLLQGGQDEATRRILHLIWLYDDDFIIHDEDHIETVKSALVRLYEQSNDPRVALIFTALTLKIFTRLTDSLGSSKQTYVQDALTKLRDYMKDYLKIAREHYIQDFMSEIPWWSDRYLKHYLSSMLWSTSGESEEPVETDATILILMNEILDRLRLLVGDVEFKADKILWSDHTLQDIMNEVQRRLNRNNQVYVKPSQT